METILFTKNDLTSGVEIPADVRKMLSFIANWDYEFWDDDFGLALWYSDTYINVYQLKYGLWSLSEATRFKTDLIAAGIIFGYSDFVLSSEKIHCPSCDYEEYVTALCIRRCYIK